MDRFEPNLFAIIIAIAGFSLVPFVVVTVTAFLKIAVVVFLVRNALGTQQTPPNLVLYGIAIVLTVYVATPVLGEIYARLSDPALDLRSIDGWRDAARQLRQPVHDYLVKFTRPQEREFFLSATRRVWNESAQASATNDDLVILVPSFVISELTRAFEIGFLLYLPFIVIDLVVANVLMSMGMMMVSPLVISVPFKLFLFVMADGWSRLMHGLVLSYG
jgi:type III secretion protein R